MSNATLSGTFIDFRDHCAKQKTYFTNRSEAKRDLWQAVSEVKDRDQFFLEALETANAALEEAGYPNDLEDKNWSFLQNLKNGKGHRYYCAVLHFHILSKHPGLGSDLNLNVFNSRHIKGIFEADEFDNRVSQADPDDTKRGHVESPLVTGGDDREAVADMRVTVTGEDGNTISTFVRVYQREHPHVFELESSGVKIVLNVGAMARGSDGFPLVRNMEVSVSDDRRIYEHVLQTLRETSNRVKADDGSSAVIIG